MAWNRRIGAAMGATLVGVAAFVACVLVLHVLLPELVPLREAVSYYVHGKGG
jgi:hypothetical protein